MNQSEFEANTCNRCQVRENTCYRVMIGLGLVSHWLKKSGASFVNQSLSAVKQNQSNYTFDFTTLNSNKPVPNASTYGTETTGRSRRMRGRKL